MAKKDEGLPVAVATQGGLLATLAVLLVGTATGMRAWIVLIKAAIAFLLVSAILRFLVAAILQVVRLKAEAPPEPKKSETETEIGATAKAIASAGRSPEPMERAAS
jgi:large-conductance mechanosensitive channel